MHFQAGKTACLPKEYDLLFLHSVMEKDVCWLWLQRDTALSLSFVNAPSSF